MTASLQPESIGTMAAEDGGRVDFARLRDSRRQRLFQAMDAHELDVLVLGRPANVRFASGARQLWTAGARPFAPGCVAIRDTEAVHVLSVWDEGIPPEIGHDRLYGLSWDPGHLMESLAIIPGLRRARRIGTDAFTPLFAQLFPTVTPDARIVDGGPALWQARSVKDADEVRCLLTATAVAEAALAAMIDEANPGTTERHLLGVLAGVGAALGVAPIAAESVAFVMSAQDEGRFRHLATGRRIDTGDLVVLNPGALYAGYEGGLGRTVTAGDASPSTAQRRLAERAGAMHERLVAECRPGRQGRDLKRVCGPAEPAIPVAYGVGLGVELPIIGDGRGDEAVLVVGSVLAVQTWVTERDVGGCFQRDLVLVGERGPQVLSRFAPSLGLR